MRAKADIREEQLADGWTVTKDHSLSAVGHHPRCSLADLAVEVLTLSAGSPPAPTPVVLAAHQRANTALVEIEILNGPKVASCTIWRPDHRAYLAGRSAAR